MNRVVVALVVLAFGTQICLATQIGAQPMKGKQPNQFSDRILSNIVVRLVARQSNFFSNFFFPPPAAVNQTKQARSSFNANEAHYSNAGQQVWNPSNRFELASFIPTAILFLGLVLLVIPLCLSLFTPFFFGTAPYAGGNPWYGGYHGRRKRDVTAELNRKAKSLGLIDRDLDLDSLLPSASTLLETVLTNLGRSLQEQKKM